MLWYVILKVTGMRLLWDRDEAGCLPLQRDLLQSQAHTKEMVKYTTKLEGTGFKHPGMDLIRAHNLAGVELPQLSSNMFRCKQHCRSDRGKRYRVK